MDKLAGKETEEHKSVYINSSKKNKTNKTVEI